MFDLKIFLSFGYLWKFVWSRPKSEKCTNDTSLCIKFIMENPTATILKTFFQRLSTMQRRNKRMNGKQNKKNFPGLKKQRKLKKKKNENVFCCFPTLKVTFYSWQVGQREWSSTSQRKFEMHVIIKNKYMYFNRKINYISIGQMLMRWFLISFGILLFWYLHNYM